MTLYPLSLLALHLFAGLQGGPLEYKDQDFLMKGYLAFDDSFPGKRPCVLVVHEWWGANDYAIRRAKELAELGYLALAIDMYGAGKTTENPEEAASLSRAVMTGFPATGSRFTAALKLLQSHPLADAERTAAIGYCFGGTVVLEMAKSGADLDAVVAFHSSLNRLVKPEKGKVKAQLLICHGEADGFIPAEAIPQYLAELDEAEVSYSFVRYPGAKHSFTNPAADEYARRFGFDLAYQAEADRQSWQAMVTLFRKVLAD
jgi:dienelactone hydrolase